jgi:hypothetical protein
MLGGGVCTAMQTVPDLPEAARSELLRHYPSLSTNAEVAIGDINGDKIDDVAAIINYTEGNAERSRIALLTGTADGKYALAYESESWEPAMRRNEYIGIKHGAISITASSSSYTEYSGTSYMFVRRGGDWVLAGLEYTEGEIGRDARLHISANLLTDGLIERRKTKNGYRNSHRKLIGNYKLLLSKFNLAEATDANALR